MFFIDVLISTYIFKVIMAVYAVVNKLSCQTVKNEIKHSAKIKHDIINIFFPGDELTG